MADTNTIAVNNRKGPDLVMRIVDRASLILWAILIVNVCIILSAKPLGETFFDRLFHVSVQSHWDFKLLKLSFFVSLGQFAVSLFYLFLNTRRLRRKDDKIRKSIITSLFFSLLASIVLAFIIFM